MMLGMRSYASSEDLRAGSGLLEETRDSGGKAEDKEYKFSESLRLPSHRFAEKTGSFSNRP
jgi:hypothetical protein